MHKTLFKFISKTVDVLAFLEMINNSDTLPFSRRRSN